MDNAIEEKVFWLSGFGGTWFKRILKLDTYVFPVEILTDILCDSKTCTNLCEGTQWQSESRAKAIFPLTVLPTTHLMKMTSPRDHTSLVFVWAQVPRFVWQVKCLRDPATPFLQAGDRQGQGGVGVWTLTTLEMGALEKGSCIKLSEMEISFWICDAKRNTSNLAQIWCAICNICAQRPPRPPLPLSFWYRVDVVWPQVPLRGPSPSTLLPHRTPLPHVGWGIKKEPERGGGKRVPRDDRQITHLICVYLKHLLYAFFLGCVFGASFRLFFFYKRPKAPPKKII